jgi:tetratricopeptide (TPR) repeat protein
VQAILEGGEVLPELRELILNRAGGNPLFVEEFTHNLLEKGLIDRKGHQFVLTCSVSDIQVPDSIQGIITSRIDRIEENLKRVIQVASVIGREFALRILQTIMGMREELKSHLLNLQGLEFISEKRLFPELEYIFKHALIQEVAYNSLLQKRRKEIHEKIGTAIETLYPDRLEAYYELLAYHYTRSERKEKALKYLELANQKASKLNAMEEAKAYFDEAMQLLNTLPETRENRLRRISLLVNNVIVFQLLWKFPEYYELLKMYESMAVELENPKLLGALYARLGHLEWAFGMLDQSIETETKAVEINEACGNAVDAGYAYMILQWDYLLKGDYDLVIKYKDSAVRMMERQFNLRWYLWAIAATSLAYTFCGCWDDAVKEGQKELKVAEEYSDNSMICFAHWNLSTAYAHKGDLDQAVEHAQMALDIAPTPADRVWAQVPLCLAWFRAGKAHKAIDIMPQLISTQRAARFTWSELTAVYLGRGYVLAGEFEKAGQTLEEVLKLQKKYGMKFVIGSAYRLLGEIALRCNTVEALSNFEKSITILTEIKAENELALAYAGYGRLYKQQGNVEKAREYLNQALETFDRLGSLIEPEKVRKELLELPNT